MSLCIAFSRDPAKKSSQSLNTQNLTLTSFTYPVRSEARGVPHLLVAPGPSNQVHAPDEDGTEKEVVESEDGGYYADGAYTAVPMLGRPTSSSNTLASDA